MDRTLEPPDPSPDRPPTPAARAHTLALQPLVNRIVRGLLRTPLLCRAAGSRLITVYAVGRTSGRHHAVPVAYTRHDSILLIGTSFPLRCPQPAHRPASRYPPQRQAPASRRRDLHRPSPRDRALRHHGPRQPRLRQVQPDRPRPGRQPQPRRPSPRLGCRRPSHPADAALIESPHTERPMRQGQRAHPAPRTHHQDTPTQRQRRKRNLRAPKLGHPCRRLRTSTRGAERGALLGHPVDPARAGIDARVGQHILAGQQRSAGGQASQQPPVHRIQLADVAVAERAQEAAGRRGRPDSESTWCRPQSRSTFMPSMKSAPISIPMTRQPIFSGVLAACGPPGPTWRPRDGPARLHRRAASSAPRRRWSRDSRCRTPDVSSVPRAGNTLAKCTLDWGDLGVATNIIPGQRALSLLGSLIQT